VHLSKHHHRYFFEHLMCGKICRNMQAAGRLWALSAVVLMMPAVLLQGCGGGSGPSPTPEPSGNTSTMSTTTASSTTTSTTTTSTTTTTTSTKTGPAPPHPGPEPAGTPLRGVAYGALPCKDSCVVPQDMLQAGYSMQWGKEGRDDLGSMKSLGANTVRLYHSFGTESAHDHGAFLDRAHELNLSVMPGYDTRDCPDHDCYDQWKDMTIAGFKAGFMKSGQWHPAISTLILLNEPDFAVCPNGSGWCRVKKVLSAMEGVLAAEKEMGVKPGIVNLTTTWSFAMATSIDGKVTGPGIFGFQDMIAGTANPSLAQYTPKTSQAELAAAFRDRWVHGMNTQAPWSFVKQMVADKYEQFLPHQWFIGEYGANGQSQDIITGDLKDMDAYASTGNGFMGQCFFQFQTAYSKGHGSEMNFGLFSLGDHKVGDTGKVCTGNSCQTLPVYCLNTDLPWFDKVGKPELSHRAEAAAKGWGGTAVNRGRCNTSTLIAV